MALIDFRPGDTSLELRLGYLYKDLAQVFEDRNRPRFNRYVENDQQTFQRLVELSLPQDEMEAAGMVLATCTCSAKISTKQSECCERAVRIYPSYSYAWNDLFLGLEGQAQHGKLNLPAMRQALKRLKATAEDETLLKPEVARAEVSLRQLENSSKTGRGRKTEPAKRRRPYPMRQARR